MCDFLGFFLPVTHGLEMASIRRNCQKKLKDRASKFLSLNLLALMPDTMPAPVRTITFAISLLFSSIVVAASDFRDGYIVLNSNDTITGLVDFVKSNAAYRSCHFKADSKDETIKYKPAEIKAYGFLMDKVFVSRYVPGTDKKQERVFLNVVISGLVTLYQFEDAFYLEKDDRLLHKLSNETIEAVVDGKVIVKNTNRHVAIFNMLMADLPQLKDKVEKVKLNEESLTRFVEEYNTFKGVSSTIYKDRKPPVAHDAIPLESIISVESKDGYNHFEYLWSLQKSSSQYPISLDSRVSDLSEGFNFLGGNISTISKYPVYTLVNPFFPINRNYFTLTSNPLNGQFSDGHFSPYLNVGMSGDYYLPPDFRTGEFTRQPLGVEAFSQNPFLTGTGQVGYWGGVGVSKPMSSLSPYLELRYEQAAGGTPLSMMGYFSRMQSNVTSVQVVIGFKRR